MSSIPTRFPLAWPAGWKRTDSWQRKSATFRRNGKDLSVFDGVERVLEELDRLGVQSDDVIVSTNVKTRLDGLPRSDQARPADPGVCVYWQKTSKEPMRCMAIDRYDEVADNLAAIAATLEAMRAIERHGGAAILDRAFTGFTALPASTRSCWEVLGIAADSTDAQTEAAYRRLAAIHHPDKPGGSHLRMSEINAARDEALRS